MTHVPISTWCLWSPICTMFCWRIHWLQMVEQMTRVPPLTRQMIGLVTIPLLRKRINLVLQGILYIELCFVARQHKLQLQVDVLCRFLVAIVVVWYLGLANNRNLLTCFPVLDFGFWGPFIPSKSGSESENSLWRLWFIIWSFSLLFGVNRLLKLGAIRYIHTRVFYFVRCFGSDIEDKSKIRHKCKMTIGNNHNHYCG